MSYIVVEIVHRDDSTIFTTFAEQFRAQFFYSNCLYGMFEVDFFSYVFLFSSIEIHTLLK